MTGMGGAFVGGAMINPGPAVGVGNTGGATISPGPTVGFVGLSIGPQADSSIATAQM